MIQKLLLVMGSDFEMYVVKNEKSKKPPFSLINECLASFFLRYWQIKAPKVKLIWVSGELIKARSDLSLNHKLHFYDIPCFGSEFIPNSFDINTLLFSNKKRTFNKLKNPLDLFHITLFDTWVENDDRKPTNYNLVLEPSQGKLNIIPIDNAYIFSTISYKDLNPKYVAVSTNDHLLVSDLGYLIKKNTTIDDNFIMSEREYFYLCIKQCERYFDKVIRQIADIYTLDSALVTNLKAFLFSKDRNKKNFRGIYL
jgi:hypothetical protein